jgi:hypothetical protein
MPAHRVLLEACADSRRLWTSWSPRCIGGPYLVAVERLTQAHRAAIDILDDSSCRSRVLAPALPDAEHRRNVEIAPRPINPRSIFTLHDRSRSADFLPQSAPIGRSR